MFKSTWKIKKWEVLWHYKNFSHSSFIMRVVDFRFDWCIKCFIHQIVDWRNVSVDEVEVQTTSNVVAAKTVEGGSGVVIEVQLESPVDCPVGSYGAPTDGVFISVSGDWKRISYKQMFLQTQTCFAVFGSVPDWWAFPIMSRISNERRNSSPMNQPNDCCRCEGQEILALHKIFKDVTAHDFLSSLQGLWYIHSRCFRIRP